MNNFHIYEEVGRGKYSVVYKVSDKKSYNFKISGQKKEVYRLCGCQVYRKES